MRKLSKKYITGEGSRGGREVASQKKSKHRESTQSRVEDKPTPTKRKKLGLTVFKNLQCCSKKESGCAIGKEGKVVRRELDCAHPQPGRRR